MPGKVILRNYGNPPQSGGIWHVSTVPPLQQFAKKFWHGNARDPFAKALGFASMSAAALGFELVDETGRIGPVLAAELVAEQAAKRGADVVPIFDAMRRRAE